jgi:serine O-acetyltransferase
MEDFINFLLKKVYHSKTISIDIIDESFERVKKDINYHYPNAGQSEIANSIINNSSELVMFLYRLGIVLIEKKQFEKTQQIHWLLREICNCEIYFNTKIGEGFYVVHGIGTVIGSRNIIGKGFKVHQGCTIGHKKNGIGNGSIIGDNFTMYSNSAVIGEVNIGNNVTLGANVLVSKNISSNQILISDNKYIIKEI